MTGASPAAAQLLVFRLDEQRFALPLASVARVVRAVAVTPLPGAPAIVHGVIDIQGRVVPVVNLRRRLHIADRAISPADWFLIAQTAQRTLVLVVDESDGVVERPPADIVSSAELPPGLEHVSGVVAIEGGLALVHDLERFLSLDEGRALDDAMDRASST